MKIQEHVPLAGYTTFGVGGAARYFAEARSREEVVEAVGWADRHRTPLYVLGGGSNLLVPDEGFAGLVVRVLLEGMRDLGGGLLSVGAGEDWDGLVSLAVTRRLAGIECLAGIPGSTGGTPVQNVGAYGQEVAQTIVEVEAFDRERKEFVRFDRAACGFRYRGSRFNTEELHRYVVTRVDFQLRPGGEPTLTYADLQRRFAAAQRRPTLEEVAAAVREIRQSKGMLLVEGDPDCRSAGSFFKNPVVGRDVYARIQADAGCDVPHWDAGAGVKLPAAWMLEQAGFGKGYGAGAVRLSSKHTLALTNRGGATFADVMRLQKEIVAGVRARFGVTLEREPVVMGSGDSGKVGSGAAE